MRQDALTHSWKSSLFFVLITATVTAITTKWYLEKEHAKQFEDAQKKGDHKKPASTNAGALPLAGNAMAALSGTSSYSVLPSQTTSRNNLDEYDTGTPENSREELKLDDLTRRKTELLKLAEEDRAIWPKTPLTVFSSTPKNSPEKKAPTAQSGESRGWSFWPLG